MAMMVQSGEPSFRRSLKLCLPTFAFRLVSLRDLPRLLIHEGVERLSQHFFSRVAEHLRHTAVDVSGAGVLVDEPDAFMRGLDDLPVLLFAGGEGLLRSSADDELPEGVHEESQLQDFGFVELRRPIRNAGDGSEAVAVQDGDTGGSRDGDFRGGSS